LTNSIFLSTLSGLFFGIINIATINSNN
jgi:hypothetical protein